MIAGFYPPTRGIVLLQGRDITKKRAHQYTKMGVARTFQIMKPLANLSVVDNVISGAYFSRRKVKNYKEARELALETLQFTGLYEKRDVLAKDMGTPSQKRLEMARALVTSPDVLLLDEVMAGLNPTETDEAIRLIFKIRDSGITIFMIEHIMRAVVSLCEKIIVLHHGEKIAEGPPDQVMNDEYVIEVYLGKESHGDA
jgi:branched-chain amino acid transport system ATP-binding protein